MALPSAVIKLRPKTKAISLLSAASLSDPAFNPPRSSAKQTGFDLWIQRLKLGIDVVFFIELGMILVVIPWTPVWTQNSLLTGYPALKMITDHGFVRGAVSGLGLINIWIGISDAVRYKE